MSQTEASKAVASEERTEEAKSFVRRVRTAARRKYTVSRAGGGGSWAAGVSKARINVRLSGQHKCH